MSAVDQHAEAHRLRDEEGYGARRIAKELGITRHAATQLLARPLPQPVAVPVAEADDHRPPVADPVGQERPLPRPVAGPVAGVAVREQPVAVLAEPVGHVAGVARLFRLPGARSPWLQVDLSGRPWLVRDLMRLARIGLQIPYVVDVAVRAFAAAYHQAVTSGHLAPGQDYEVRTSIRPRRAT